MEKPQLNFEGILWISPQAPKDRVVEHATSWPMASTVARTKNIAVVVVDSHIGEEETIEVLNLMKRQYPAIVRLVKTSSNNVDFLTRVINEVGVLYCLDTQISFENESQKIAEALKVHWETSSHQQIVSEITTQNKKLEEFTQNLEFLVEERTRSVESSKDEVAKKLKSLRQLVAFIKKLSLADIVDDWLLAIGNETRSHHGVGFPSLAFTSPAGIRRVMTFRGKDLIEIDVLNSGPPVLQLRYNNRDDQKFLANAFGRPVASVVSVPMGRNLAMPVLYFEHFLDEGTLLKFIEYLNLRLQPMALSLDRILLEHQTKYASKQWELTFDSLQDPVAIIDLEYNVIRSNKSFYSLKQKDTCHKIFANQQSKCVGCPVEKSLRQSAPQSGRIHVQNKIFDVFSFPVGIPPTHFINYYVDITNERKLFSRLVQNEKMAALGTLAGHIAHELNNPLSGIRSLCQLLQIEADKNNKADLKNDLVEIEKAAERSCHTIKNLLEFSRPTSFKSTEVVALNEVVCRTLPLLKAGMREHRSTVELFEGPLDVKVNLQLIQQVFFNIVVNSCQAMLEPGELHIKTRRVQDSDRDLAEIVVSDSGHGISKEDLERVFEPFFTTKEKGQGTGIGLSMSKSIVERFGGKIFIESVLGQGTTVRIQFPLVGS